MSPEAMPARNSSTSVCVCVCVYVCVCGVYVYVYVCVCVCAHGREPRLNQYITMEGPAAQKIKTRHMRTWLPKSFSTKVALVSASPLVQSAPASWRCCMLSLRARRALEERFMNRNRREEAVALLESMTACVCVCVRERERGCGGWYEGR
jgi:hypothetical protein